ncbi:MAG: double zinc ribbon domain-containing protein [Alphaproteobacteria bacterium]
MPASPSFGNIKIRYNNIVRAMAGMVYTPLCLTCEKPISRETPHTLCVDCWQNLAFLPKHHCSICAHPLTTNQNPTICFVCQQRPIAIDKIVVPFLYQQPLVKLILKIKHGDDLSLSQFFKSHLLSALDAMLNHIASHEKQYDKNHIMLLPVPSHIGKIIKRKYNQAEILARPLAKHHRLPLVNHLLQRTEPTSQKDISADERFRQLKTAFALNKKIWAKHRHKKIILVDDVVTTCATMHHLALLLKKNGAHKVYGIAIARAVKDMPNI